MVPGAPRALLLLLLFAGPASRASQVGALPPLVRAARRAGSAEAGGPWACRLALGGLGWGRGAVLGTPRLSPERHRGPGAWEASGWSAGDRAPRDARGWRKVPLGCLCVGLCWVSRGAPGHPVRVETVPALQLPTFKFLTEISFPPPPTFKRARTRGAACAPSRRSGAGRFLKPSHPALRRPWVWGCVFFPTSTGGLLLRCSLLAVCICFSLTGFIYLTRCTFTLTSKNRWLK